MEKITLPPLGTGTATASPVSPKIKLPPLAAFGSPTPIPKPPADFTPSLPAASGQAPGFSASINTGGTTTQAVPPAGPGIFEAVGKGALDTVTHPVQAIGGAVKGVLDFTFNVSKGLTGFVGADKAKQYIQDSQDDLDRIFQANLKDHSEQTAGAVGEFVGAQIPYILGGEAAVGLGTKIAAGGIEALGGGLSADTVSKIGTLTKLASNAAGFVGLHQLEFQPEEGSRAKAAAQDLLVLGVLESAGAALTAYANSKAIQNARAFLERVKTEKPPLAEIEQGVAKIKSEIEAETGKQPQQLVADIVKQTEPQVQVTPAATHLPAPEIRTAQSGEPPIEVPTPEIQPKPESVKVSRSQLPVGTGEEKVSGLEARIKGKLDALTPEDRAGISTYQQMNKTDQIKKAIDYVSKHPDDALEVLKGNKPAPEGLLHNSIFLAMEETATGDTDLAVKLASLRSTRAGQEISILTERDPLSPVKYMTDLAQAKIEAFGGREKLAALRKQEIGTVKRAISINRLAKTDWNAFINTIKC